MALLAGLREIRLITSPFRVLMADCLQVFSGVFFIRDMMVELGAGHSVTRAVVSLHTELQEEIAHFFDSDRFKSAVSALVSKHIA